MRLRGRGQGALGGVRTHDFLAPLTMRSDHFFFRGTRLPYAKFPPDPGP